MESEEKIQGFLSSLQTPDGYNEGMFETYAGMSWNKINFEGSISWRNFGFIFCFSTQDESTQFTNNRPESSENFFVNSMASLILTHAGIESNVKNKSS